MQPRVPSPSPGRCDRPRLPSTLLAEKLGLSQGRAGGREGGREAGRGRQQLPLLYHCKTPRGRKGTTCEEEGGVGVGRTVHADLSKGAICFLGRHGWHLDTQIYSIIASLAPPTLRMNHFEAYQGRRRRRRESNGDRPTEGSQREEEMRQETTTDRLGRIKNAHLWNILLITLSARGKCVFECHLSTWLSNLSNFNSILKPSCQWVLKRELPIEV